MSEKNTQGLPAFLLGVLSLSSQGKKESCEFMKTNISKGIASALYEKYQRDFDRRAFSVNYLESVDEFFRQYDGCIDGNEHKYVDDVENSGLLLLIGLTLDLLTIGGEK